MTLSENLAGRPQRGPHYGALGHAVPSAHAAESAWRRWEMSTLPKHAAANAPRNAETACEPLRRSAAMPHAVELESLRLEARVAGAADGRKEGLAQGHAQGYAAGLAAGEAAASAQAEQLRALASALPEALRRADTEIAETLLALALDVARQVVHRTLRVEPGWILPLVQDLLHMEPALRGEPRLLLHSDDVALVKGALEAELQTAGWQVRADDTISRGGCLVQAATGEQDATVETRWARVTAAIGGGDAR
jgi:flagellar assembly protein FliH